MLEQEEIIKPKIDIRYCNINSNISPIDIIKTMDEDTFEQFINEWLYVSKTKKYKKIMRIGGAGDKGRDVIAYHNFKDNVVDIYQCKHYRNPLTPSNFFVEFGKLCYYTYTKQIPIPLKYFIVASNGIGSSLLDLIHSPDKLKTELKNKWPINCENNISKSEVIKLNSDFEKFIDQFDFSIIEPCPISEILTEYLNTIYGEIRFGGINISKPQKIDPTINIQKEELPYVNALLTVYAEKESIKKLDLETLQKKYKNDYDNFCRHRTDYYSIETIRRFVRDTFTDSEEFNILKDEIYNGIIDVYDGKYNDKFERLCKVLSQATEVNSSKSLLERKLNLIGVKEKKGTCHMLVNDKKIDWGE